MRSRTSRVAHPYGQAHAQAGGSLYHEALFYRSDDAFVTGTARFVRSALAAGHPVMVAVPGPKIDLLRLALNGSARQVRFLDMTAAGRNPARIIPAVRRFADEHRGRRVSFVGEPIWPGRSDAEVRECTRHEALLNAAFADTPMAILCPYDEARLAPPVIEDAHRTHPVLGYGEERRLSRAYTDPAAVYAWDHEPLPAAPAGAATLPFDAGDLALVRRFVATVAVEAGLVSDRLEDLLVSVNEVVTNTLAYTNDGGTLRVWRDGERPALVCEVRDSGHIADILAGRYLPAADAERGRGLWLVNQFCDLVEIRADGGGLAVRLHVLLD